MNILSTVFSLKNDGLYTPCRLVFKGLKNIEVVRFESGLIGKASFSDCFKDYATAFSYCGIFVPEEPGIPEHLKGYAKREIALNDKEFGEAFYRYFFPKLKKNHPHDFYWEKYFPISEN
jgi:hypothetical protein